MLRERNSEVRVTRMQPYQLSVINSAKQKAKLDLHGLTKDRALRELAQFLDPAKSQSWVCVITGTGSHSSNGPVLRGAVENFLKRRGYIFSKDSPGSFLVDSTSSNPGYFHASCEEDTKVVVKDYEDEATAVMLANRRSQIVAKRGYASFASGNTNSQNHEQEYQLEVGPSVQELHDSEKDLKLAREESLELQRSLAKQATQDKRSLEQALLVSAQEHKQKSDEESNMLRAARELSKKEVDAVEHNEADLLNKILKESEKTALREMEEERQMENILEISRLESNPDEALRNALERSSLDEQLHNVEEEELIRQAIALSLQEQEG